ncbi:MULTISPECIES: hypothetical protein [unclassified Desulfurobacterium]|uniref:hypothetical protein n=1 Tax=Desulfurobacterium sp. TC5-1 TaxID=1158318 RepID=UPI0003FC427B|nr:hypothetical protein [Desulfurobacterium sp. TC5-1]
MKRWIFLLVLPVLLLSSCVFQTKPSVVPYPWNFIKRPSKEIKGIVECSVSCSNGTAVSGKALLFVDGSRALIRVYGTAGVYGGRIVIKDGELFADRNLAPFAKYLRSPQQLKSMLTGYIYEKSYKIITPYELQFSFGKLTETYIYAGRKIKEVVITDGICSLKVKPIKVKEVK